jgi:hypothetical protein
MVQPLIIACFCKICKTFLRFYDEFCFFPDEFEQKADSYWAGLEPTIYRTRGEQANHFTSDVVL